MPVPICVRHYFLFLFFFVARAKHWMYVGGIPFVYSQSLDGKYVLSAIVNRQQKKQCFPHGVTKGVSHPSEGFWASRVDSSGIYENAALMFG